MEKYRLEVYNGSSRKLGKVYLASDICAGGNLLCDTTQSLEKRSPHLEGQSLRQQKVDRL